MKSFRTYFAWTMLFAALTFAVPKLWLHNCIGTHAGHEDSSSGSQHDAVDHGGCAACVFSLTSSISPSLEITLFPPQFFGGNCLETEDLNVLLEIQIATLRGPPMA